MDVGENGRPIALFRHLDPLDRCFYKSTAEIRSETPSWVVDFYEQVPLPTGGLGPFMKYGIEKAAGHVADIWGQLYEALKTDEPFDEIVLDWNLNKGTVAGEPSDVMTYWPN